MHIILVDLLLYRREVCCWEKQFCSRGRTMILTDSARKRNMKEVLANYNKTRIRRGHQHDCWMELKEALRVQTLMSHCGCSSEIRTCIINNAGIKAAQKRHY